MGFRMFLMAILLVVFVLATIALWSAWRRASVERDELQKAIYETDRETGFVERMKPEHYVPTRHKVIFPGEAVAAYEDCRRYEVLRDAKTDGALRRRRARRSSRGV